MAVNTSAPTRREPIAIVGLGCRFPGAPNPAAFWELLVNGMDAIGEIPPDRFSTDALYYAGPPRPGRISTRWGGFLRELDTFDAEFFGIAAREAAQLDPQQRLLLEVAWESLEDAGIPASALQASPTGVYVGLWTSDYETRLCQNPDAIDVYTSTGSGRHSASGRVSFALGLEGPSMTIDTGCSSALVAVHLACRSLWDGESTLALAGAVNVILEPSITIAYSQSGMMAADGRCKFGDAKANGYVRSEGAGMVVLKPLSRAIADRDSIYAVIRGGAINHNGRSSGMLSRPAEHGQREMLRQAYRFAGVDPREVQYVEAHGTGTNAGDPVELTALGEILAEGGARARPCLVGSVKTNIGHTESAAGIAGLIKVALALKHGVIPASLHLNEPNPQIPWSSLPLAIPRHSQPWPDQSTLPVAGVSAFGISGTNAHLVLQAVTAPALERVADRETACLLPLSARSDSSLEALGRAYQSALSGSTPDASLDDVCYSAGARRSHHSRRLAIVVRDRAGLLDSLAHVADGTPDPQIARADRAVYSPPRVAFVFSGQGGQWAGMGRELLNAEPVFRAALESVDEAIRTEAGWSVLDIITGVDGGSPASRIDVVQPTIFAVQVALAALWRAWGIEPAAVIGHSMGEVAAAHVAGALTLRDAVRVICGRSALLATTAGKGAMAIVALSYDEAVAALKGVEDRLSIGASNSDHSTVISGDPTALAALLATLQAREVFGRAIKVDVASHSPQMDPLCVELLGRLADLEPEEPLVPFYSTVAAARIGGRGLDRQYWTRNLRQPVLFSKTVRALVADGIEAFVEVGPHPVLEFDLKELTRQERGGALVVGSTRRDSPEREALLTSLAHLYVNGCDPRWDALSRSRRSVQLPSYPWQRERHWVDRVELSRPVNGGRALGARMISSLDPNVSFWPLQADAAMTPDRILAAMLDAARDIAPEYELSAMTFAAAVPQDGKAELQLAAVAGPNVWTLRTSRRDATAWQVLADAVLRPREGDAVTPIDGADLDVVEQPIGAEVAVAAMWAAASAAGQRWLGESRIASIDSLWLTAGISGGTLRSVAGLTSAGLDVSVEWRGEAGELLGQFGGVHVEQVVTDAVAAACVHELTWQPEAVAPAARVDSGTGALLIIGPWSETTDRLAAAARAMGRACARIIAADSFSADVHGNFTSPLKSVSDLERPIEHWSASGGAPISTIAVVGGSAGVSDDRGDALAGELSDRAFRLALTTQWLSRTGRSASAHLWVVTSGAWSEDAGQASSAMADAAMWGLRRTIATEHPELTCSAIDLGVEPTDTEIRRVLERIAATDHATEAAGDGITHARVPRYVDRLASGDAASFAVRQDATYLISGGSGGLGLEVADWLVGRGARHLALINRRAPGSDAAASIEALKARGAQVRAIVGDVSLRNDVASALTVVRESMPALGGIFHAAAVVQDALVADLDRANIMRVCAPKAVGAWHLHTLTENDPLDFFIMCSSIAVCVSEPGQGSYAAANIVLDALAGFRRAKGLPALSVQWGGLAGVGLANRTGTMRSLRDYASRGIKAMTPRLALAALERAHASASSTVLIAPIRWDDFGAAGRQLATGLFDAVVPLESRDTATAEASGNSLRDASPADRPTAVRRHIREALGAVLRCEPARLDPNRPFGTMGLDSLLALELVRRLSGTLDLKLSATTVFSCPTLNALEQEIFRRMDLAPAASVVADQPQGPTVPVADATTDVSEEDAVLALMHGIRTVQR